MKISNLIHILKEYKKEHGDQEVHYEYEGPDASTELPVKEVVERRFNNPLQTMAVIR